MSRFDYLEDCVWPWPIACEMLLISITGIFSVDLISVCLSFLLPWVNRISPKHVDTNMSNNSHHFLLLIIQRILSLLHHSHKSCILAVLTLKTLQIFNWRPRQYHLSVISCASNSSLPLRPKASKPFQLQTFLMTEYWKDGWVCSRCNGGSITCIINNDNYCMPSCIFMPPYCWEQIQNFHYLFSKSIM